MNEIGLSDLVDPSHIVSLEEIAAQEFLPRASLRFAFVDVRTTKSRKGADLAIRPSLSTSFSLVALALRNDFVEFENRQEHRNDDATHDHAKKNDKHRFDQ
jgi:hypothetical protein